MRKIQQEMKDSPWDQLNKLHSLALRLQRQRIEFLQSCGLAVGDTFSHEGNRYEILGWRPEGVEVRIQPDGAACPCLASPINEV
jgi:hypothetical protein